MPQQHASRLAVSDLGGGRYAVSGRGLARRTPTFNSEVGTFSNSLKDVSSTSASESFSGKPLVLTPLLTWCRTSGHLQAQDVERAVLGNVPASGTTVIPRFSANLLKTLFPAQPRIVWCIALEVT